MENIEICFIFLVLLVGNLFLLSRYRLPIITNYMHCSSASFPCKSFNCALALSLLLLEVLGEAKSLFGYLFLLNGHFH